MSTLEILIAMLGVSGSAFIYSLYLRYRSMQKEVFKAKVESIEKGAVLDASKMSDAELDAAIRDELSEITTPGSDQR